MLDKGCQRMDADSGLLPILRPHVLLDSLREVMDEKQVDKVFNASWNQFIQLAFFMLANADFDTMILILPPPCCTIRTRLLV